MFNQKIEELLHVLYNLKQVSKINLLCQVNSCTLYRMSCSPYSCMSTKETVSLIKGVVLRYLDICRLLVTLPTIIIYRDNIIMMIQFTSETKLTEHFQINEMASSILRGS